jgi:coenzyme F420 hydrogenase subunit beta
MANLTFSRLQAEVIQAGICTHCGTCAGLSGGTVHMVETDAGPLPMTTSEQVSLPPLAYDACPGKGIDYPRAYQTIFGRLPENWLAGPCRQVMVGYAVPDEIRRRGASGGVITRTLLHLLDSGRITGAVVLQQGHPRPWLAQPVIARTAEEVMAASQSVYVPAPVNVILPEMIAFPGRLAFVGLPDQVASLRQLQAAGHPGAQKVDYVLGPYVGTAIYLAAIESYLRSNGIASLEQVVELQYREGEWPGNLYIRTRSGRELRAKKFYYNYLIPFYITQASLQAVDFTNELTDISVGDAWHPRYEAQGEGFSVVMARTAQAEGILQEMRERGMLVLDDMSLDEALAMHGHMLDFKKRGAFIRNQWRRTLGRGAPTYGYRTAQIPISRKLVELVISGLFLAGRTRPARALIQRLPLGIIGPVFDTLRKSWKSLSKPVKRQGLGQAAFTVEADAETEETREGNMTSVDRIRQELKHWTRNNWSFGLLEKHFDELAAEYDEINEGAHSYFRRFTDALRVANLPEDAYMLDVCARTGNGTAFFYQQGKVRQAVCADVSREMGKLCEARLERVGFDNYRWIQLHDYAWPFANGEFDVVLSLESVEHFDRPDLFIRELGRVTRRGGTMILSTPNVLWEPVHALAAITKMHHSEGPHRFIPYRRLRHLISGSGFEVEHAETTVLIPAGPEWLIAAGGWLEDKTKESVMPLLGLRRLLICRKLP